MASSSMRAGYVIVITAVAALSSLTLTKKYKYNSRIEVQTLRNATLEVGKRESAAFKMHIGPKKTFLPSMIGILNPGFHEASLLNVSTSRWLLHRKSTAVILDLDKKEDL